MLITRLIFVTAARWVLIGAALVGAADFFGRWQPSTELLYNCRGISFPQLCLIDADRGIRFALAPNLNYFAADAVWSPDGEWIAFSGSVPNGAIGIYVMSVSEQQPRLIVANGGAPAWSPDGTRLIYTFYRGTTTEIYEVTPGSDPRLLVTYDSYLYNPAWSPDGTQFAFQETSVNWRASYIQLAPADGSDLHRITESNSANLDPAWSPDGTQIAVARVMFGAVGIAILDVDGHVLRRIPSRDDDYAGSPSWSPDGKRIAFDSDRPRGYWTPHPFAIYVMNVDGSNVYYVAEGTNPAWRPDRR